MFPQSCRQGRLYVFMGSIARSSFFAVVFVASEVTVVSLIFAPLRNITNCCQDVSRLWRHQRACLTGSSPCFYFARRLRQSCHWRSRRHLLAALVAFTALALSVFAPTVRAVLPAPVARAPSTCCAGLAAIAEQFCRCSSSRCQPQPLRLDQRVQF